MGKNNKNKTSLYHMTVNDNNQEGYILFRDLERPEWKLDLLVYKYRGKDGRSHLGVEQLPLKDDFKFIK